MNKEFLLFDSIENKDFSIETLKQEKQKVLSLECAPSAQKEIIAKNLDILFKIVRCKLEFSTLLENENIFEIVDFLKDNYYNKRELSKMIKEVLKFVLTPVYYLHDEDYSLDIPQVFWITPLGKVIISCLSASDDVLLSSTETGFVLGYKRQNVNLLVREGKLPAKRIGGSFAFRLLDVLSYKDNRD